MAKTLTARTRTERRRVAAKRANPSRKDKDDPSAVRAYLEELPTEHRQALERVRRTVWKSVPNVRERISYGGVIIFAVEKDLVGVGANPKRLSFFTMSPRLALELAPTIRKTHRLSGATIHFSPQEPLPDPLLKYILQRRLAEQAVAAGKGGATRPGG